MENLEIHRSSFNCFRCRNANVLMCECVFSVQCCIQDPAAKSNSNIYTYVPNQINPDGSHFKLQAFLLRVMRCVTSYMSNAECTKLKRMSTGTYVHIDDTKQ